MEQYFLPAVLLLLVLHIQVDGLDRIDGLDRVGIKSDRRNPHTVDDPRKDKYAEKGVEFAP